MSCTCLRNDKIAHIRSQQSRAEHAGDLPSCEITAPDTACANPSQGWLLKDFINTSALEKKKVTQGVEINSHRKGLLEHHPSSFPRSRYRHSVLDININK